MNFNGVIIFHSGSITNLKSVSAMKLLEVSLVESFLPILFVKN